MEQGPEGAKREESRKEVPGRTEVQRGKREAETEPGPSAPGAQSQPQWRGLGTSSGRAFRARSHQILPVILKDTMMEEKHGGWQASATRPRPQLSHVLNLVSLTPAQIFPAEVLGHVRHSVPGSGSGVCTLGLCPSSALQHSSLQGPCSLPTGLPASLPLSLACMLLLLGAPGPLRPQPLCPHSSTCLCSSHLSPCT